MVAAAASKAVGLVINAATARRRASLVVGFLISQRNEATRQSDATLGCGRLCLAAAVAAAATKKANKLLWTQGNVKIQFQEFHKLENTPKV